MILSSPLFWIPVALVILFGVALVFMNMRMKKMTDDQHLFNQAMLTNQGEFDMNLGSPIESMQPGQDMVGNVAEDGFEWLQYPEGSGNWFYRDQSTGQWVQHQGKMAVPNTAP